MFVYRIAHNEVCWIGNGNSSENKALRLILLYVQFNSTSMLSFLEGTDDYIKPKAFTHNGMWYLRPSLRRLIPTG